ncbi:unnamed protein product [Microthlaspi erraticum]|uniref:Expansin-like EG45 domain-containing protein n=1 Tax=Microthlaspi erraticum TaxID=1685480 RepID=A0A6D2K3L3_9BRAS|nr:unnamed protein product [Microthlaspi erraticum]
MFSMDKNYVVQVNEKLWKNGQACGKQFTMKCAGDDPNHNCTDESVTVTVGAHYSGSHVSFILPPVAYRAIVDPTVLQCDVEYKMIKD